MNHHAPTRVLLTILLALGVLGMTSTAALAQDPTATPTAAAATATTAASATATAAATVVPTVPTAATTIPTVAPTATTVATVATAAPTATPVPTVAPTATPVPTVAPGVELTIYNQNFALIKDVRALQLDAGVNQVRFTDVATGIEPATVHFTSLSDPQGTSVLEQSYQYDLANSQQLLNRYLDQEIVVRTQSGDLYTGTLAAAGDDVVLLTADGVQVIKPDQIQGYTFPVLPEGLATRPTLTWLLQAAQAGEQQVQVTYLADGLDWQADYVALLSADARQLSLSGWVTVDNQSGASYSDAHLKLVAGDVQRTSQNAVTRAAAPAAEVMAAPAVAERSFFEYHLYDIQRTVTLQDGELKQLEFATAPSVSSQQAYVYEASPSYVLGNLYTDPTYGIDNSANVQVRLEFTNSADDGLGLPLPGGTVRVYQEDADGSNEFVGEDTIDHTAVGEDLSLYLGDAFDITGVRTQTDYNTLGDNGLEESYRITLNNHKAEAVTVQVLEHLFRSPDATITASSQDYEMVDATTARFMVTIRGGGQAEITYTVRYAW